MMLGTVLVVMAAAPLVVGNNSTFLGWSADGESLVWTEVERTEDVGRHYFQVTDAGRVALDQAHVDKLSDEAFDLLETEPQDWQVVDAEVTIAVVHHLATGQRTRYQLSARALTREGRRSLPDPAVLKAEAKDFDAWKKKNLWAKQGLTGPRKAQASVLVDGTPSMVVSTPSCEGEPGQAVVFSVSRAGVKASQHFESLCRVWAAADARLAPWWDATGRRIAFTYTVGESSSMDGPVPGETRIFVLEIPPRVEVLTPARLTAEGQRVAPIAEGLGFPVSSLGVATKDREATVIFAAKGQEDAARKLAQALPGATVEPLTWKANGELVIAVGAPLK